MENSNTKLHKLWTLFAPPLSVSMRCLSRVYNPRRKEKFARWLFKRREEGAFVTVLPSEASRAFAAPRPFAARDAIGEFMMFRLWRAASFLSVLANRRRVGANIDRSARPALLQRDDGGGGPAKLMAPKQVREHIAQLVCIII